MPIAEQLEAGRLYQVLYPGKGWIIAEYMAEVAAHSYNYRNIYMDSLTTGPEKVRHVPLSHRWKKVRAEGYSGSLFTIEDRKLQTRPVTAEALQTIADLRAEIKRLDEEHRARVRELREFCE